MSLHVSCSAKYFKVGNRNFDKITQEYDPPCYWFRLKVRAKGCVHRKCIGHVTKFWNKNGRLIKGFDPLVMFWVNEPPIKQQYSADALTQEHYKVDISPGTFDLAGLMHVKLPSNLRNPHLPIPPDNKPPELCPEVEIDRSRNENEFTSKLFKFHYGIYYVQVVFTDSMGESARKIFKIWAFPDIKKCKIRTARFYERFNLHLKSLLPAV
ncbi:hypothetical protein HYV56_00175 [Candidatus Peregrinibacteria bacterium]|nr:hypothetical protein [Candidatus Peregrinibacteria bacterium]